MVQVLLSELCDLGPFAVVAIYISAVGEGRRVMRRCWR
jgi:hypothetical protein